MRARRGEEEQEEEEQEAKEEDNHCDDDDEATAASTAAARTKKSPYPRESAKSSARYQSSKSMSRLDLPGRLSIARNVSTRPEQLDRASCGDTMVSTSL